MVEFAETVNLDNLGFFLIGEAGSDPYEDFFPHLFKLLDVIFLHVFEFVVEFYSKKFEFFDKFDSGVIS